MREWSGKRYWIVGASAGLGRAVAKQISATGATVILSARSEDELNALAEECPGKAEVVPVDVADDESVAKAAEAAGHVDGVVFLAGVYWPQKAQEWNAEQVVKMLDINLTGAARVLGHVIPAMVERDAGHIVLTGSLAGFRGLPGANGYGASKAGIMSMAETLYMDLRKTGIDVQLVNPGFIRTRLTDKNEISMPFIMEPDEAARHFVEHMHDDSFSKSYPRFFSSLFRVSQFLPDFVYYRLFG
ncbi:SDR family NAD(P)-dependent oxidoreductase [Alphaproteobacteria bacterium GH1-50]|uniref:SDR family NAD(P)-dependent oxidoreductase n=1 Tax=Kangsaoukella pontilimi TaxID=2691042 RepID=A0A7C9N0H6_9RHOB|nr:SDR family NAD(P)-dependent oxidoreductase [Kangsaoukella pontilimi]MXQ08138.1 SDR family NAD(P)-dependent oxidoreductase [Kangsaoukella pontilimi]